ncbi:uncharacterized protein PITG_20148 [Phytophthora infestans T30-4]|uniref:HTH psq-type domain-containing protein n=1 Tax=Phytophthora infestans (strain T30-4) TaxID=403677 RepID=D0P190_PHYIT|nr:uncharacterized protein PITG_20148 [Phytophthora infestans T30-4]EEY54114.1 conserved hypothetical protein [Phytophthora infestans T30-4]|eukprot:XP_002895933.1 conserved hypothetical protein [Phytophthora infestans T30-4]
MLRDSATLLWRTNCSSVVLDLTREYYLQFQHGYNTIDKDRSAVIDRYMASVFRPDIVCRDFQGIRAFMGQWEKYTKLDQGLEIKMQTMRIVDSADDPKSSVTVHASAEMTVIFTEDTVKVLYPGLFDRSLHNLQDREIVDHLVGSSGLTPVELVLNFDQQGHVFSFESPGTVRKKETRAPFLLHLPNAFETTYNITERDPFLDLPTKLTPARSIASIMETRPVFTAQRDYTSRVVVPLTGKRRTPDGFQTAFESKRPAFDFPQQRPASPVSSKRKQRKPPNYLRHGDRCSIIKRVADGEPQASLAREFGVTRAAVCQMYKNRAEILSRDNEPEQLSPYPTAPPQASITQGTPTAINRSKVKGIRPSSTNRTGASVLPALTSRSKRVEGLLRRLQDERTNPVDSRRAAARLTLLILTARQVKSTSSQNMLVATGIGSWNIWMFQIISLTSTVEGLLRRLQDERTNPVDSRRAAARLTLLILTARQVKSTSSQNMLVATGIGSWNIWMFQIISLTSTCYYSRPRQTAARNARRLRELAYWNPGSLW